MEIILIALFMYWFFKGLVRLARWVFNSIVDVLPEDTQYKVRCTANQIAKVFRAVVAIIIVIVIANVLLS